MKITIEIVFSGNEREEEKFKSKLFDSLQSIKNEARDRGNIVKTSVGFEE